MDSSEDHSEKEVLVRPGFKIFCIVLTALIVVPVTASMWIGKPIGEGKELGWKVFVTYYLLSFLYSVHFVSYKFRITEPNIFTFTLHLLGGAGYFLFPFLLPFYFLFKSFSALSKQLRK